MRENHIEKTTVIISFRLFEYLYMFTKCNNKLLKIHEQHISCIFVYVDGVLAISETEQQHSTSLRQVLGIFQDNNLKCKFFKESFWDTVLVQEA